MGLHRVRHDWSNLAAAAEYIMQNAGLDEAQAGIKIARRNINNLRYADDTTLMAEREELKTSWWKWKRACEILAQIIMHVMTSGQPPLSPFLTAGGWGMSSPWGKLISQVQKKKNKAGNQMLQFLSSELLHVIFSPPRRPSIISWSSAHPPSVKLLLQKPLLSLLFSIPSVTIHL